MKVLVMAAMGVGAAMLSACAYLEQAPAPNDTATRLYNEMKVAPHIAAPNVDDRDARIADRCEDLPSIGHDRRARASVPTRSP